MRILRSKYAGVVYSMDSIQLFPTIAARVTPAYTSVLV